MSMDWKGELCFGFQLNDQKLLEQLNEGELDLPKDFEMCWAGDAICGEVETFICIKKSHHQAWSWKENSTFLGNECFTEPGKDWESKLVNWAKEHGVEGLTIGWHLLTSLG